MYIFQSKSFHVSITRCFSSPKDKFKCFCVFLIVWWLF
jgi:hypothetical protein